LYHAHVVYAWYKDDAGNVSLTAASAKVILDTTPPTVALSVPQGGEFFTGGSTVPITWTYADANPGSVSLDVSSDGGLTFSPIAAGLPPSPSTHNWTAPSVDGFSYRIQLTGVDFLGHMTTVSSADFTIETSLPTITAFSVNGGVHSASNNVLSVSLSAHDAANNPNGIVAYQFSLSSGFPNAVWLSALPSTYTYPHSTGSYPLYARVKDGLGGVSAPTSFTPMNLTIGSPPIVNITQPDGGTKFTVAAGPVHVAWTIASVLPLKDDGLFISYSTDGGITTVPWSQGLSPYTGLAGTSGVTGPTGASAGIDLPLPVGLSGMVFSVIVGATDELSNVGLVSSAPLNAPGQLSLFAGRNSSVIGGSDTATSFSYSGGIGRDPSNGDLYLGHGCQLLLITATTGVVTRFAGDPAYCGVSGVTGLLPANAHFNMGGPNVYIPSVLVDSQRNVYWGASRGIWRYDRQSGLVSLYVGCVNAPCSTAAGLDRQSFTMHNNVYWPRFDLGADDRLYFNDTQSCGPPQGTCVSYYRVEDDGKVSALAGSQSPTGPSPSDGGDALTAVFGYPFVLLPGDAVTPDRIFGTSFTTGGTWNADFWEIVSGQSHLVATKQGTMLGHYLPSRGVFPITDTYAGSTTLEFIGPTGFTGTPYVTGADAYYAGATDVADDGNGGFFYVTDRGRLVSYFDYQNVGSTYAGASPTAGDGGPATQAELRAPRKMNFDAAGNAYIEDGGNRTLRKVDTLGVISSPPAPGSSNGPLVSTGVGPQYITANYGFSNGFHSVYDVSGSCAFFCRTSGAYAYSAWATTGANAFDLADRDTTWGTTGATGPHLNNGDANFITAVAVDGTSTYVYILESGVYLRSYIKKIDGSGNFSEIAGDQSSINLNPPDYSGFSHLAITTGNALEGNIAGYLWNGQMRVVGGKLFFIDQYTPYFHSADLSAPTPTWVTQSANAGINAFVVDPVTMRIYFTAGNKLYWKDYAAGGGGPETLIADFNGALSAAFVAAIDPNASGNTHAVYISDGNSIYKYVDASGIP
jgi:hypothetical protein